MKAKEVYLFYFLTFLNGIRHVTDNCRVQAHGENFRFFPVMTDGQTADDYNKKIRKLLLENQRDFPLWLQEEICKIDACLQKLSREVALQRLEMQRTQLLIEHNCIAWEYQQYISYTSPYFNNVDYVGENQTLCESQGISAKIIAEKTVSYQQNLAAKTTLEKLLAIVKTYNITISCKCEYDRSLKFYVCYLNVK